MFLKKHFYYQGLRGVKQSMKNQNNNSSNYNIKRGIILANNVFFSKEFAMKLVEGVELHLIKSEKFKMNHLTFRFSW